MVFFGFVWTWETLAQSILSVGTTRLRSLPDFWFFSKCNLQALALVGDTVCYWWLPAGGEVLICVEMIFMRSMNSEADPLAAKWLLLPGR